MKYYPIRMYLVNARQKLGFSQYRVALEMGVSHQHYNRIENGAIGEAIQFKTIVSLAYALNIPVQVIWEEEEKYQASLNMDSDDNQQSIALLIFENDGLFVYQGGDVLIVLLN